MNVVKNENDLSPLFLHYICLSLESLIEKTHPHGKIGRNHLESKKHLHPRSKSQTRNPASKRVFARVSFRDGK